MGFKTKGLTIREFIYIGIYSPNDFGEISSNHTVMSFEILAGIGNNSEI